ncbi:hypothetical protein Tco_0807836 [Tanacetum coccineum]
MSSASSAVTYTSVYTNFEPGRVFWGADDEEITDGGIPQVIIYRYDGLPMQPVAPPLPDYIPGLEDPQTPQDEHVFPVEEQPLPPIDSPTAESPGYVTESDPEEDPEEFEDDETEDSLVDYPVDGGDDDSSRDDADDEDEDEEDEEEEHLAPTDYAVVIPTDHCPASGFHIPSTRGALARVHDPLHHFSPPPVPSPLLPSSGCPTQIQTLRMTSTQALVDAPPLPPLLPSLYIPPPVDCRHDILESEQPPRKRLCLSTLGSKYEVRESYTTRPTKGQGIDYGFFSTVDAEDDYPGDSMDCGGGGLYFRRGLGSLDRIESGVHHELQTHRDHVQIMAPVTRRGLNTTPNNTNPNNMTPESVQAMIDQAL